MRFEAGQAKLADPKGGTWWKRETGWCLWPGCHLGIPNEVIERFYKSQGLEHLVLEVSKVVGQRVGKKDRASENSRLDVWMSFFSRNRELLL